MSDMNNAHGILDIIHSITSNRESGQLEIRSSGCYGALLFNEGRLVDARLESLTGFQAVNAAVSLRDVQFSFNPSISAPRSSSIAPNERVVLQRFFGIETAGMGDVDNAVDPEIDWNMTPHQVVPLTEVDQVEQDDFEETPTVEVKRVAAPVREEALSETREEALLETREEPLPAPVFPVVSRRPVAVYLTVLLLVLAVGAIALIPKLEARRESASLAPSVTEPSSVAQQPSVAPESSSLRNVNVQDLTGEWRVINTVQKTAYKSFDNLQIGFRLRIKQTGKDFTAKGEKVSENGRNLPAGDRTPIRVTGSIDGDKVVANFVEDGTMRQTNGRFVWKLQGENAALSGRFVSAAANSSGKSAATRQP